MTLAQRFLLETDQIVTDTLIKRVSLDKQAIRARKIKFDNMIVGKMFKSVVAPSKHYVRSK